MRFLLIAVILAVAVAVVHSNCTTSQDCHNHHNTVCGANQHAACIHNQCRCITKRSGEACQTVSDCPDCTHEGHVAHCEHGHCHCSSH